MSRILMMGPPGVGKGTQAATLADVLGVPTISTGEIFRDNIRRETLPGIELRDIIQAGDYVPDVTTNAVVADRLSQADCLDGFILDGYSRTRAQVDELDRLLQLQANEVDIVIELTAPVIRHRIEVCERDTAELIEAHESRGCVSRVVGTGSPEVVGARILDAIRVRR